MTATAQFAILGGFAGVLAAAGVVSLARYRRNPDRRERERRLAVHRLGRLADGMVTDASEEALYYTYTVSGVTYTASQDIRNLRERLPADFARSIGPVTLKYALNNPANSIVICEEWSGLHVSAQRSESSEVLKCSSKIVA